MQGLLLALTGNASDEYRRIGSIKAFSDFAREGIDLLHE